MFILTENHIIILKNKHVTYVSHYLVISGKNRLNKHDSYSNLDQIE